MVHSSLELYMLIKILDDEEKKEFTIFQFLLKWFCCDKKYNPQKISSEEKQSSYSTEYKYVFVP